MKAKILVFLLLDNVILLIQPMPSPENNEHLPLITETSLNHTIRQSKDAQPIVIHTQLKNYDQPTLREYQECHENLEKCKKVCEGVQHIRKCVQECPVCPLLIKEKIVVQGINDTNFSQLSTTPVNTTNIIRLTNEIRNTIETHQGNITNFNENNVHLHQNISRVGGKFGLGYNNTESCCIVISSSKDCEIRKFSTAKRCHRKRYRVCGSKCKSRVMMAKHVIVCEEPPYIFNEDYTAENCLETVKYVPYQPRKRKSTTSRAHMCSFSPYWPYVSCNPKESFDHSMICKRCLGIPYFHILRRGIPEPCMKCFLIYARPITEISGPSWYPVMPPDMAYDYLFEDKTSYNVNSWQQDKTKCRLPDGTFSDKCEVKISDFLSSTYDSFEILPESQGRYLEHDLGIGENYRKRHHTFDTIDI